MNMLVFPPKTKQDLTYRYRYGQEDRTQSERKRGIKEPKNQKMTQLTAETLQLHAKQLVNLHTLSHAEIQHDLLATTRDSIGTHITVQPLDLASLATAAITQAAKDLTGLAGTEFISDGGLGFEAGDGTAETKHGLILVHVLALVHDVLEPVVRGLDLTSHVRELHADNGVLDEFLAEGAALASVLDGFLVADAGKADGLDDDADTLVVEVGHDDWKALVYIAIKRTGMGLTLETLVLLANQVLNRDLDVLKSNIGGAAAPDTLAVHASRADAAH